MKKNVFKIGKRVLLMIMSILTAISCFPFITTTYASGNESFTVLILDGSGSMGGAPAESQKASAIEFCRSVVETNNCRIAIVELNTNAAKKQEFTNDLTVLTNAINNIPSSGGTNINGALELADQLLTEIESNQNKKISKNIVLCSDGLPEHGKDLDVGKYTEKDSKNYYSFANYAYNTALKLQNNYSIYSVGFFHEINGQDYIFGRRFLSDIQNAGYYEATNFSELIDNFLMIASDVGSDYTYNEYLADLIRRRKNAIAGIDVLITPVKSDVWGKGVKNFLDNLKDVVAEAILGTEFEFTSKKYFQTLFIRLMAEKVLNIDSFNQLFFELSVNTSDCLSKILSTYSDVKGDTRIVELPQQAKIDIQDYFNVNISNYSSSDICSIVSTTLGGAATIVDAIEATAYYKAIAVSASNPSVFDSWLMSAHVSSYESHGYLDAFLGGDQRPIMADALLELEKIINEGYEEKVFEYWKNSLKKYTADAAYNLVKDFSFTFIVNTLGSVLGLPLTVLSTFKTLVDVCDFIDQIYWSKQSNVEKNIAALKCIESMFKDSLRSEIGRNNADGIVYSYNSLMALFNYSVKYQKENVNRQYFDYYVSDSLFLDNLWRCASFGLSDISKAKKISRCKSHFDDCIKSCEEQIEAEKKWYISYSRAYNSLGKEYTIIFDQNVLADTGTTHFSTVTIKGGEKPSTRFTSLINNYDYHRNGYMFVGWYTDLSCTQEFDFNQPVYESAHVYAKWVPEIRYNYTGNGRASVVSYNSTILKLKRIAASTNANNDDEIEVSIPMVIDKYIVTSIMGNAFPIGIKSIFIPSSVTHISTGAIPSGAVIYCEKESYAQRFAEDNNLQFVIIDEESNVRPYYTVSYDANGGNISPTSEVVEKTNPVILKTPNSKKFNIYYYANNSIIFKAEVPVRCKGWSLSPNDSAASFSCGSGYVPDDDTTLFAVWENYADTKIYFEKPQKNGYEFCGWSTSPSSKTVAYHTGDSIRLKGDIVLYAIWKEQTYYNNLTAGEEVEIGTYPQNEVTDTKLINELNKLSVVWNSYGYYSGDSITAVGSMRKCDYMKYADVSYNGEKYRAVTFSEYRPYHTYYPYSTTWSEQDNNGYETDKVYWFKYEPISWVVLNPSTGLVICKNIIDSQAFSDTIYANNAIYYGDSEFKYCANNYEHSTIRQWLNSSFYNTAFNPTEKDSINVVKIKNDSNYPKYNSNQTSDKINLLSYGDVFNSKYGFDSYELRWASVTDYSKSQGVSTRSSEKYADWMLRTAGDTSKLVYLVNVSSTQLSTCYQETYNNSCGIRPAMYLKVSSDIIEDDSPDINPSSNCSCACHKKGIVKFFFKIGLFFQKIFKKNKICKCGAQHY